MNKKVINNFISSISLDNISFSYPSRENVLTNINIDIKKNSFVSFVGSSGSGKTTCSDIILGLYKPTLGSISIDDCPLDKIDTISYLDLVGYVQQDTILLDGSIRENLLSHCLLE